MGSVWEVRTLIVEALSVGFVPILTGCTTSVAQQSVVSVEIFLHFMMRHFQWQTGRSSIWKWFSDMFLSSCENQCKLNQTGALRIKSNGFGKSESTPSPNPNFWLGLWVCNSITQRSWKMMWLRHKLWKHIGMSNKEGSNDKEITVAMTTAFGRTFLWALFLWDKTHSLVTFSKPALEATAVKLLFFSEILYQYFDRCVIPQPWQWGPDPLALG